MDSPCQLSRKFFPARTRHCPANDEQNKLQTHDAHGGVRDSHAKRTRDTHPSQKSHSTTKKTPPRVTKSDKTRRLLQRPPAIVVVAHPVELEGAHDSVRVHTPPFRAWRLRSRLTARRRRRPRRAPGIIPTFSLRSPRGGSIGSAPNCTVTHGGSSSTVVDRADGRGKG